MPKKASVKKVVKKEPSKTKKTVINEDKKVINDDTKQEAKRLLTRKTTALLYFVCGACWIISAIIYSTTKQIPIFDIVLGLLFVGIGVLYLLKDKKEKENR